MGVRGNMPVIAESYFIVAMLLDVRHGGILTKSSRYVEVLTLKGTRTSLGIYQNLCRCRRAGCGVSKQLPYPYVSEHQRSDLMTADPFNRKAQLEVTSRSAAARASFVLDWDLACGISAFRVTWNWDKEGP